MNCSVRVSLRITVASFLMWMLTEYATIPNLCAGKVDKSLGNFLTR